jgi:hypothetical protein
MPPQTETQSPQSVEPPQPEAHSPPPERWSRLRRIALRFAAMYLPLFTLWNPVHFIVIPPVPQLFAMYQELRHAIVVWVGESLLHVQVNTGIPNAGNGSHDTTLNCVEMLC